MKARTALGSKWEVLVFSSSTVPLELRQGQFPRMRVNISDSGRSEESIVVTSLAVKTLTIIIGGLKLLTLTLTHLRLDDLYRHRSVDLRSCTFVMSLLDQSTHDQAGHQSFVLTASREPNPRSVERLTSNIDIYGDVLHPHHLIYPSEELLATATAGVLLRHPHQAVFPTARS
jgi:hypothetical protein